MPPPRCINIGKEQIFKEIYIDHFKKVESFAYKYLQNNEKAKGVAQDVFLSVWENLEKLRMEEDIVPLLFVITKFKCLNLIRKEERGQNYIHYSKQHTAHSLTCAALESETLDNLLSREVKILINKAFSKMPIQVKETFELSRNKELKYYEIAQKQNISVKTVEYRMSYAFRILREHLKDYLVCFAIALIHRFIF